MDKDWEELHEKAEKVTKEVEKNILRYYKTSLDEIYDIIGKMFRKYEKKGKLTYSEMAKYNRLQKLHKGLTAITVKLYKDLNKEIKDGLKDTYTLGFNQVGKIIERETYKRLRGIIRHDVLEKAVTNDISGLRWTDRMGIHRNHAVMKIRETVTKGLHDGKTYKQMADDLNDTLSGQVINPMRIVRTEGHRVMESAKLDRLDEAHKQGIKMHKVWVSSRDERVRSTHSSMDGQKVPYEGEFTSPSGAKAKCPGYFGIPEEDINCRCVFIVEIK